MIIEEFGPRVASVWNHLRTATRNLVEKAWQSSGSGAAARIAQAAPYDPRADQELSQLLSALDDSAEQTDAEPNREAAKRAQSLADACANLLSQQTQSAEVFARLIERAHQRKDYAQVDGLAALLPDRLAPSELCDLARANNVVVRALAQEALTQMPIKLLVALLRDPVDSVVARQALERQAYEFGSADAQRILKDFDEFGIDEF
ncbi:MAG: hypothetical protein DMF72_00340 [Acidobacteria bacterium]|nr:MAG: hypothetical protein DMF72_00340 [Acidobacteriota bacterium]